VSGFLDLGVPQNNRAGGRLVLGAAQRPGRAGRPGVAWLYFLSWAHSIIFINALRTQDKSLKYSENPRTSARLSVLFAVVNIRFKFRAMDLGVYASVATSWLKKQGSIQGNGI
jgi:hypothetical protein